MVNVTYPTLSNNLALWEHRVPYPESEFEKDMTKFTFVSLRLMSPNQSILTFQVPLLLVFLHAEKLMLLSTYLSKYCEL